MPGLLAKAKFSIGEGPILFHPHLSTLPSGERRQLNWMLASGLVS